MPNLDTASLVLLYFVIQLQVSRSAKGNEFGTKGNLYPYNELK